MGNQFIDMTGWKMWEHGVPESRWEVLHQEVQNNKIKWRCRCSCESKTEKFLTAEI